MILHVCDRCGKVIDNPEAGTFVQVRNCEGDVAHPFKLEYELCTGCRKDLDYFLNKEKKNGKDTSKFK